jgi:hypothetical protein
MVTTDGSACFAIGAKLGMVDWSWTGGSAPLELTVGTLLGAGADALGATSASRVALPEEWWHATSAQASAARLHEAPRTRYCQERPASLIRCPDNA